MAAKKIQVSDDSGTTWYTLPGSTGDFKADMAVFNDTVFGQSYSSQDVSIGTWMITSNAYFKGVAGYLATLRVGGTPIALTAEPCTLVTGKTYQITNIVKRLINYATSVTVFDNAVDRTANVLSIDYLSGQITFVSGYAPTGPVTVTGFYVPTAILAKAKTFTIGMSSGAIDTTTYEVAQANGGWRSKISGLNNVKLDLTGIFDVSVSALATLSARTVVYVDIAPDGVGNTFFRGFFKFLSTSQAGAVGALEDSSRSLALFVPDGSLVVTPFSWYFTAQTTLNLAVRKVITSWQNDSIINVKYLPDGGTTALAGQTGQCIVTDCSMSNALEGQNEFKMTFEGTGAPTAI
jgi:predicted secreted protein